MAFIQTIDKKTGRRYKVHYTDPLTGKRRSRVFTRAKDAHHFKDGIPKSDYIHNSDTVTVSVAADKWLEVCKISGRKGREPVEKATLRPYRLHARYIEDMIGGRRLNELTPQVCEQFKTDLLAKFTRSYARKILTSFKGILSEARTQGWLKSDPAENVRIVLSERAMPKHETWLTLADVRSILQKADEKAASSNKQLKKRWQRYQAFVYVMVFTGMRPGEVLGLPWRNVLFDEGAIKVDQDMDDDGKIGRPKSKSAYRTIPMGRQVMDMLRAWKEKCPASKLDLVFPNWQGNPEKLQNVYRRCWYTLQEETGLVDEEGNAKYPLKDLRHVRASMEIDNGANPKEITTLMGHSTVKITYDVYGHLFEDHAERRALRAGQVESLLLSA
jgi:integrase